MLEDRIKKSISFHDKGYNCTQCVACTYAGLFNMDEKDLFRIGEGFGAGMGDYQGVCGALSGIIMLCGLTTDGSGMEGNLTKPETYIKAAQLKEKFLRLNGSINCHELKAKLEEQGIEGCNSYIESGVRIAGEMLEEEGYTV
jgi:C_GCAxxG_C_C family probable redox protein